MTFFSGLLLLFLYSCDPSTSLNDDNNPAIDGFNLSNSDSQAIEIADKVMTAMGGRKNWDETRYLSWNFFGSRQHYWDKYSGNIIIHSLRDSIDIEMNIDDPKVISLTMKGQEVTQIDSLEKFWERGKNWWINDSYWLIMPFKLKDSGVTLKYTGVDTTMEKEISHVLELTFEEVGRTPQNRYEIFVDTSDHFVKQWNFYTNRMDPNPRFKRPWTEYESYDRILLSSGRGNVGLSEISASDTLASFFQ